MVRLSGQPGSVKAPGCHAHHSGAGRLFQGYCSHSSSVTNKHCRTYIYIAYGPAFWPAWLWQTIRLPCSSLRCGQSVSGLLQPQLKPHQKSGYADGHCDAHTRYGQKLQPGRHAGAGGKTLHMADRPRADCCLPSCHWHSGSSRLSDAMAAGLICTSVKGWTCTALSPGDTLPGIRQQPGRSSWSRMYRLLGLLCILDGIVQPDLLSCMSDVELQVSLNMPVLPPQMTACQCLCPKPLHAQAAS